MAVVKLSRAAVGTGADTGICGSDLDDTAAVVIVDATRAEVVVVGSGSEGWGTAEETAVGGSDDIPDKFDTRLSGLLLLLRKYL